MRYIIYSCSHIICKAKKDSYKNVTVMKTHFNRCNKTRVCYQLCMLKVCERMFLRCERISVAFFKSILICLKFKHIPGAKKMVLQTGILQNRHIRLTHK
jgi:hypothetical protein